MKISAVYKITNTVTNDFYIGSSKNVKNRWAVHKCQSVWKNYPNKQLYQDMRKYGVDKFELQILAEVEPDKLKELEQQFIETLKPTYNNRNANGLNIERKKEYQIEYYQQNRKKCIEYQIEYYQQNRKKCIEYQIEYYQQNRKKCIEHQNRYNNQTCFYNGETISLATLAMRFQRAGIPHPAKEAKKYLVL